MTDTTTPTHDNPGAEGVPAARPPGQAGGGSSTLTSALSLRFGPIALPVAVAFNRRWHSHLPHLDPRVAAWLCYGATCGDELVAAAVWSLPVARLLPQDGSCLELRRFVLSPACPRNSASRMLGWMARDISRRRPAVRRLVSYHDCAVHTGGIYKAAGWLPRKTTGGGRWNHSGRHRAACRIAAKVRWELELGPVSSTTR